MKLFLCCVLFLPLATMVVTAPVRARRENVLSFITDELKQTGTTENTKPASITEYRNPPTKPATEEDSEATSFTDMSEAKSEETFATNGFTDAVKDLDSHEIMIPTILDKEKAPSRRTTGSESMGLMDTSRRLVQNHGSREQSGPHRPLQASREWPDVHSDEEMKPDARGVENLPGKQITHSHGDKGTGSDNQAVNLQRKTGNVDGLNGLLAQGESRELLDRDSLEDSNGKLVPQGNRDTDYDETQEYYSSETHLLALPEHMSSSLAVPIESQAS